jgi:hypothetical protein
MQILLPRVYNSKSIHKDISLKRPLFFLAGPVRGGGDWQARMAHLIEQEVPDCILAVPCRWTENHQLSSYFTQKEDGAFPRQLNWEQFYLEEAGIGNVPGCVLFWLAFESEEDKHPGPEPYSMDTRGEVAEWRMRIKFQNARVVVGADDRYYGLSQIQRNYNHVLGYEFPIYKTMEETAHAAVLRMKEDVEGRR